MAVLPTGDTTTQWTVYIKANAGGGDVMKLLRAALKVSTGSTREDSTTLWKIFQAR